MTFRLKRVDEDERRSYVRARAVTSFREPLRDPAARIPGIGAERGRQEDGPPAGRRAHLHGDEGTRLAESAGTVEQQVAAVLDAFAAAWSARDLQRAADLWDEQEGSLSYIAEELGEVLFDRDRIVEHLLRTEHRLTASRVSLGDVRVRELAPGLALATFTCRWEFEWVAYSRVSAVLRQRGPRWCFVHYMEAPFHMEDWSREAQ